MATHGFSDRCSEVPSGRLTCIFVILRREIMRSFGSSESQVPTSWHGHELHAAGQLTFAAVEGPSIRQLLSTAFEATIQDATSMQAFAAETLAVEAVAKVHLVLGI